MEYGMITTQCQGTKVTHHLNKHHENQRTDFAKMGAAGYVLRMMGSHVTDFLCSNLLVLKEHFGGLFCDTASI